MSKSKLIKLAGSERTAPKGSKSLSKADDAQTIEISLSLRSKGSEAALARFVDNLGKKAPKNRRYLSREEFERKYGADQADVEKVEAFAHMAGLTVADVHHSSRNVRLRGTVRDLRRAFGANLKKVKIDGHVYRVRQGAVSIPAALRKVVVGVHGLDNRPVATPHLRAGAARPMSSGASAMTVAQIAKAYNFPTGLDGSGQCVAVIELNGPDKKTGKPADTGYSVSDLKAFFKTNNIPYPNITSQGVDGGSNLPGKSLDGDREVALDIELVGAVAPAAKIVVFFTPNSTNGFIDAINAAALDKTRKPSVISISYGGPEDAYGKTNKAFLDGLNRAMQAAAAVGVTVCISSGDSGSAGMPENWDGKPHADFPASSPYALACGGTRLTLANGNVDNEVVWNDGSTGNGAGGGGVSNYFSIPAYQAGFGVPSSPTGKKGRGVPDLSGNADPFTGYKIFVRGKPLTLGGTSAVAPLTAGLIALINQALQKRSSGPAGNINGKIYSAKAKAVFRDVANGNNDMDGSLNGLYTARKGVWDACSGLGVADGGKLLGLLTD